MRYLILIAFFGLMGCEVHHYQPPDDQSYVVYNSSPSTFYSYERDYEWCYGDIEPYWKFPEWCDDYCCTWYVGYGCYEEWCYWDQSCGWEYDGMWCH